MCLHPHLPPGSCLRPHGGPEPPRAFRGSCGGFCDGRSGVSASPRLPPLRSGPPLCVDLRPRGHTGASPLQTSVKQTSSYSKIISVCGAEGVLLWPLVPFSISYICGVFLPSPKTLLSVVEQIETNFRAVPPSAVRRTPFLSSGSRICSSERKHPLHEMHVLMVLCAGSRSGSSFRYGRGRQLAVPGSPVSLLQPLLIMSNKVC